MPENNKKKRGNIKTSIKERLMRDSGGFCARCRNQLDDPAYIGNIAHICGDMPNSARYDPNLDEEYVNGYDNLLILCPNCHTTIDKNPAKFPVDMLRKMKQDHINWVKERLTDASVNFTFAQLDTLTNYLRKNHPSGKSDYTTISLKDKINKNQLKKCESYISQGLARINDINEYFNQHPDQEAAQEVTSCLKDEYRRLKNLKFEPTEIFSKLWDFICHNNSEFLLRGAGLGILVYFFERCEVFEK